MIGRRWIVLALAAFAAAVPARAARLGLRAELRRRPANGDLLLYVTVRNEEPTTVEDLRVTDARLRVENARYETLSPLPVIIGELKSKAEETVSLRFGDSVASPGETIVAAFTVWFGKKGRVEGSFRVKVPPRSGS